MAGIDAAHLAETSNQEISTKPPLNLMEKALTYN